MCQAYGHPSNKATASCSAPLDYATLPLRCKRAAWAYMQLCKNYGTVDFYTTPITSISEANAPKEKKDMKGVLAALAPELAMYKDIEVPNYG